MKRVAILDWDGTTFLENDPLPHTPELLRELDALGAGAVFVTNNSSRSTGEYRAHLQAHGLWGDGVSVVTSNRVTIEYVRNELGVGRVFLLGTDALKNEFEAAGIAHSADADAEAVIVGFDKSLTYGSLQTAHRLIGAGLPFIATHADRVCPTRDGGLIDCGAVISALTASTGRRPTIVGKPEPPMAAYLDRHFLGGCEKAVVIGDRPETDGKLAARLGIAFIQIGATGEEAGFKDGRLVEKIRGLMHA